MSRWDFEISHKCNWMLGTGTNKAFLCWIAGNVGVQGQVWKLVWILEVWSENEFGKWHFLVWNMVKIWRTWWHTPTKNSQEYPPPGRISLQRYWQIDNWFFNRPILVFTQVLIRRLEPGTRISALFPSVAGHLRNGPHYSETEIFMSLLIWNASVTHLFPCSWLSDDVCHKCAIVSPGHVKTLFGSSWPHNTVTRVWSYNMVAGIGLVTPELVERLPGL